MQSEVPTRRLGRTNQNVSAVAMGGGHLGSNKLTDIESVHLIHRGIDQGITFLDNSWDYDGGRSEERMGQALGRGGYRRRVFLATKFDGRDARTATAQLEQSLRRLESHHIDLWQLHENIRPDDAERVFAPGGAIEAMLAARDAGKVRFLGFTGHKDPQYHVHMFEVAARNGFAFDTVQMPLNIMDPHFASFERTVIPVAQQTDTGIIAMKTYGDRQILGTRVATPLQMLHYSMNLPVASVVIGIDSVAVLDEIVTAAVSFRPLSEAQVAAILARSAPVSVDGAFERYKTTDEFDATSAHPEWLGSFA
ncbi:MAG TPA: aldo/keto reductase [Candidatus Lustribacter sp.]|jgi:aryl-alcohol dehydrogenase-like predicted oxidoreductase|nr:aldo/keto reductase [Candidatus Lustribacter sp.]